MSICGSSPNPHHDKNAPPIKSLLECSTNDPSLYNLVSEDPLYHTQKAQDTGNLVRSAIRRLKGAIDKHHLFGS